MGASAAALAAYIGGTGATAGAAAGTATTVAAATAAEVAAAGIGSSLAAGGISAGTAGAAAGGIGLGTVAAAGSLVSTAYALTRGVPKMADVGRIVPTDNARATADAADKLTRSQARAAAAGGMGSTLLTGGLGTPTGPTTSRAVLGGV